MSLDSVLHSRSFNNGLDNLFSFPNVITIEQEKLQSFKYFILSLDFNNLDTREKAFIGKIISRIHGPWSLITNEIRDKIFYLNDEFYKYLNISLRQDNADEILEYVSVVDNHECYLIDSETNIISYKQICDRLLELGQVGKFARLYNAAKPDWKHFLLETPTRSGLTPKDLLLRNTDESSFACLLEVNPNLFSAQDIIKTGNPNLIAPFIKYTSLENVECITLYKIFTGPNADEMVQALLKVARERSEIWEVEYDDSLLIPAVKLLSVNTIRMLIEKCPYDFQDSLWNTCCPNSISKIALQHRDEIPLFELLLEFNQSDFWNFKAKNSPLRLLMHAKQNPKIGDLVWIDSNAAKYKPRKIKADLIPFLEKIHKACPPEKINDLWGYTKELVNLLHIAAASGEIELVEFVFKNCPSIMSNLLWSNDVTGNSPLHYAAFGGNPEVIQLMLDRCPFDQIDVMWKPNKHGFEPLHYSLISKDTRSYPFIRKFYSTLTQTQLFVPCKDSSTLSLMDFAVLGCSATNVELVYQEHKNINDNINKNLLLDLIKSTEYRSLFEMAQNVDVFETLTNLWSENKDPFAWKITLNLNISNPEIIRYISKHHTSFDLKGIDKLRIHSKITLKENIAIFKALLEYWDVERDSFFKVILFLIKDVNYWYPQNVHDFLNHLPFSFWNNFVKNGAKFSSIGIDFLSSADSINKITAQKSVFCSYVLNAMPKELVKLYFAINPTLLSHVIRKCTSLTSLYQFLFAIPEHLRKYLYVEFEDFTPLAAIFQSPLSIEEKKEAINAIVKHCPKNRQKVIWIRPVLDDWVRIHNVEMAKYLLEKCPKQYLKQFLDTENPDHYRKTIKNPAICALIHAYWPKDAPLLNFLNPQPNAENSLLNTARKNIIDNEKNTFQVFYKIISGMWSSTDDAFTYIKLLIRDALFAPDVWEDVKNPYVNAYLNDKQAVREMLSGATPDTIIQCPDDYLKKWIKEFPEEIRMALARDTPWEKHFSETQIEMLLPFFSPKMLKFHVFSAKLDFSLLNKIVSIDYGTEMAVNDQGIYEPTGRTYDRIEGVISTAFERLYFDRVCNINWTRENESDLPQQEIKRFLNTLSPYELVAYIKGYNGYEFHRNIQLSFIKYNLFSPQQLAIVVPFLNLTKNDFEHCSELKFHLNVLSHSVYQWKKDYLDVILDVDTVLKIAFGAPYSFDALEKRAKKLLEKLKVTKRYKERDDIIIQLRGIIRAMKNGTVIKNARTVLKQLRNALLKNEYSLDNRKAILLRLTIIERNLLQMQGSNEALAEEVLQLRLATEDPEAERFLCAITGDFMEIPIILPNTGTEVIRVDFSTLKPAKTEDRQDGYINFYTNTVFPEHDFVCDSALFKDLQAYLKKKKLI